MRIVGETSRLTAKDLDKRSEFLREVVRRNPEDASSPSDLNDAGEVVLGTYGAIVGVELLAGRFQSLAEIARSYGCGHMNLIDAFDRLSKNGQINRNLDSEVPALGAFKKASATASLISAIAEQRFVTSALSELDSELYQEALSHAEEHYLDDRKASPVRDREAWLKAPERQPEVLDRDGFAALCSHFANAGKQIATVSIGNGIEVSPLAMILLHELSKGPLKLDSMAEVARVYGVKKAGLANAFQGLLDCAMVLGDSNKERLPDYTEAVLSENGKRALENRRVAISLGAIVLSVGNETPYVSREAYALLQLTGPGMTINTTIGSECLRRSRGFTSRVLSDMAECGLLIRNEDLTYSASKLGMRVVKEGRCLAADDVSWLRSAEIDSRVKGICSALLDKVNEKCVSRTTQSEPEVDGYAARQALKDQAEARRQEVFAEREQLALQARRKAVQDDAQRISNHLINLASKKNRQEFYAYEIGFVPGLIEHDNSSGNAIRRDAVKYLFEAGFFSFSEDFADTLANGIKPSEYQPAITLHPLGDYQGSDYLKFDRSRTDYDDFRVRSYLRAVTVRPRSIEAICKAQKFDVEDFQDFVDVEVKDKLVSYCWAMDSKSGALIKGVVLNGIDIQQAKRFESPSLDWLSLNGPADAQTLLQGLGLINKDSRVNKRLLDKLSELGVVIKQSGADEVDRFALNTQQTDQALKDALRACRKFVSRLDGQFITPTGLINYLSEKSYVRTKDLYVGAVGYWPDGAAKPTEEDISRLVKCGALDRYKSQTGMVDYLMVPQELEGSSRDSLIGHVEDCLMGLKSLGRGQTRRLKFPDFSARKDALGIELKDSEMRSFNMAKAIYEIDPPQRTDLKPVKDIKQPSMGL